MQNDKPGKLLLQKQKTKARTKNKKNIRKIFSRSKNSTKENKERLPGKVKFIVTLNQLNPIHVFLIRKNNFL